MQFLAYNPFQKQPTTTWPQKWSWSLLLFVPVAKKTRQQSTFCRGARPNHDSLRRTTWPTETALQTKLYGCREDVERDSPIHLADQTDGVNCELEKEKKATSRQTIILQENGKDLWTYLEMFCRFCQDQVRNLRTFQDKLKDFSSSSSSCKIDD